MTTLLIADDHPLFREALRGVVTRVVPDSVLHEADTADALYAMVDGQPDADLLLLDLNMPGRSGLEVLTSLRETHSAIKVLVVSMYPEDQYALRCLKAGAQGYANKAGDPVELIAAVRTVMQGRKYLTAEVAQMLADSLAQPTPEALHTTLSERELQTLIKIASGRRLSDIAEELMLSPKTVSVYRSRVLEKLKLSNNAELTVYAIRNQLV